MKTENEIRLAWEIWHLIARLNDVIWDFYEDEFIDLNLKESDLLDRANFTDYMGLDNRDSG
jgi:hypothetical protein